MTRMRRNSRGCTVLLMILGLFLCRAAAAQEPLRVQRLAWLAGCWQLSDGDRVVEEHWLLPRAGTMLGIGRTVRGNRLIEYETILLREQDGRLAYDAHPSSQPSATFLSTTVSERLAVFENLEDHFPQRVGYERTGSSLLAWIEGSRNGRPSRIEFPYKRVPCVPEATVQPVASTIRTPIHSYEVVGRYPHDPGAFTQGLIYRDGVLFESTGLHGRSSLRKVRLETGEVLQRHDVDRRYFAEGLTELGGELFQLTWDSGVGFVYDRDSFALRRRFSYHGEGWGLTHDGARLIVSDGTPVLRTIDPKTLNVTGRIKVTDHGAPVDDLNELEFVRGQIYANVWLTDRIAMVDPASGRVTGWIDLTDLGPRQPRAANAVLNGIAYDAGGDRLFVTGKLWPTLYEIRIKAPQ